MGSEVMDQAKRLWRIVSAIRAGDSITMESIGGCMQSSLYVATLLEVADNEDAFMREVNGNTGLRSWAESYEDSHLAYLVYQNS